MSSSRQPDHSGDLGSSSDPTSTVDFQELCAIVHGASGIMIDENKRQLVKARLRQRLQETGAGTLSGYLEMLRSDPTGVETSILLDLISTNVTSFFREQHHFDHLVRVALPESQAVERQEPMRIWSAACSSGEEPYSIAMSLAEELGADRARRFLILATDISTRMVSRAREGRYPSTSLASVPQAVRERWFESEEDEEFRVAWALRDRVRVNHLNLLESWPMKKKFSAIFCRNVLIYFNHATCQRLINRFWDQLYPGGYLYIGHSESLSNLNHEFEYAGPTIYRRPAGGDE